MAVTLKQVAEHSGLSLMTVSYVLNNKRQAFRPETCERVLSSARTLGYRPNASARATRSGRFGSIALLQSSQPMRSVLPAEMLAGIQAALGTHNLNMMLADMPDSKLTDDRFVPQILRQLSVDGLLVNYNMAVPQRLIELIARYKLPAIWLNAELPNDCLRPDDFAAGRLLARRLIELGHRRIAYVDYVFGSNDSLDMIHYSTRDRLAGCQEGMREAGLSPRVVRFSHKLVHSERVAESLRLLREPAETRPTAFIAYNDNVAHPFLYAAALAGVKCPAEVSLASFFATPLAGMGVEFGGIFIDEYEMGRRGVEMLRHKIDQPAIVQASACIAPAWQAGQTCAACAR